MEINSIKDVLLKDKSYFTGIILVICSAAIYLVDSLIADEGVYFGIFILNYLFTFIYWVYVLASAIFSRKKEYNFFRIFPALVLALISAYSLNKLMNVFDMSPLWLTIILIIISITSLSLIFYDKLSRPFRILVLAVVGVAMVLFVYLSLYLIPVYPYSLFFFWGFGISLHGIMPFVFLIFLIIWVCKYARYDKKSLIGLAAGITGVLIGITVFTVRWNNAVSDMNDIYRETFVEDDVTLPGWIRVAQQIPENDLSDKILKTGLTYTLINGMWDIDSRRVQFTEQKIHNPFIVTAYTLGGKPSMSNDEKIKILKSIYNTRHQAAERLWSDEGIKTTWINSTIQIWPQYRMAYTEQVIMLRNTRESWRGGEAVYTFHLPEGSVVTSLSLWVNGQEEKGILTTKSKADSAYRRIVGVEVRDPSLVHWQEGSTVLVRVFPVTTQEERTFKIGITSPLEKQNGKLIYKPVYFEGTDFTKADEKITVKMMAEPENISFPAFLKRNATGLESAKNRRYDPQWEISMPEVGLSTNAFCFDGNCYKAQKAQSQQIPVDIQRIYLDINQSWTKSEFNTIYDIIKDKKIKTFDGKEMITIGSHNKDIVFEQLSRYQFSLFPIHLIKQPEQSLLISKSTETSPNLSDIENSRFFKSLKKNSQQVYFFNIGNELSPYLKTLREYRVLNYSSGNQDDLTRILQQKTFKQTLENDSLIAIHDAGISIEKQAENGISKAPDHIMRLFAYNHIMQQYAQSWNAASPLTDSLVAEARQAYVVSPVSSLVVLESQADYDRFGIEDIDNSLKNASKNTEEVPVSDLNIWELIIALSMITLYFYRKKISAMFH